jgi:hypothetical protein
MFKGSVETCCSLLFAPSLVVGPIHCQACSDTPCARSCSNLLPYLMDRGYNLHVTEASS